MSASYDAAGYLKQMSITRGGVVPQQYDYEWDEVGRLTKAARKDGGVVAAELTYAYDASDQRVRKSAGARHSIYVFGSLELRSTGFDGTGYTVDDTTEVPYLFGHGVRLARVTYTDAADFQTERRRIFLELGDHLGSTAVVMDRATGELVERSAAYAYGAAESHYRPARWAQFREDYRFTGKEDDLEVGLIYFGARYLNPQLGRWISADPLAVHAPGQADLNLYAYVHGKVLVAVDPVGLCSNGECSPTAGPPASDNPPEPNADQLKTEREQTVKKIEEAPTVLKDNAEQAVLRHGEAVSAGVFKASAGVGLGAIAAAHPLVGLGLGFTYLATSASDHDSPEGTRGTMFGVVGMVLSSRATLTSGQKAPQVAGDTVSRSSSTTQTVASVRERAGGTVGAAQAGSIEPGKLTALSGGEWRSNAGLVYGQGSAQGNRVLHVLEHSVPNLNKPVHGVFASGRNAVLPTIDRAWMMRGVPVSGDPGAYVVPMRSIVGTAGQTAVKIIVRPGTSNIITAYPVF